MTLDLTASKLRIIEPDQNRVLTAAAASDSRPYRVVSASKPPAPHASSWNTDIVGSWRVRPVSADAASPVIIVFTPDGKGAESETVMTSTGDSGSPALRLDKLRPTDQKQQWTLEELHADENAITARIVNVADSSNMVTVDPLVPLIFPPPDMTVNSTKNNDCGMQVFRFVKI